MGLDMGAMTPCLIMTLGLVESWNDCLVIHSWPMGSRSDRSNWSLFSKGNGSDDERYLSFCGAHVSWSAWAFSLSLSLLRGTGNHGLIIPFSCASR